ncbi:MAG: 50S ribosomal protein L29, partial [Candidatus Marsarchaeota archaeon]|nr:50S ribosomal protein L29 [Candidatus Marsarchaeota archaeon]
MTSDNLKSKLDELRIELAIEKRKVASTGVASKVVKTKDIRRTIARINTILNSSSFDFRLSLVNARMSF